MKEAVADGKLSATDMQELKALREELDVTDAADDKTQLRREIYNEAVDAVRRKGQLSATGFQDLAKIQKFLALRDDQIETAKWDVNRLRQLTEIRRATCRWSPRTWRCGRRAGERRDRALQHDRGRPTSLRHGSPM